MIVKMKFLSITGPRADIDRMTKPVSFPNMRCNLKNALTELKTVDNLMPFLEMNPYRDPLAKVTQFLGYMKDMPAEPSFDQSEDEILEMIRSINHDYMDLQQQKRKSEKKERRYPGTYESPGTLLLLWILTCMRSCSTNTSAQDLGKIQCGLLSPAGKKALLEDIDALFLEGSRDASYVYGVYFRIGC